MAQQEQQGGGGGGMGMSNPFGMAAGAVFRIAGGITGGIAADKRRERWQEFMDSLPTPDAKREAQAWFDEMEHFYDPARKLSERAQTDEMMQNLRLRELGLPGITGMIGDASRSIAPLLRGELPAGVMDAFTRAGGASTTGLGFGGSQFGALNTGLFGARGSLGAIQTGMGLLPTLMSTIPQVNQSTSTMGLLGNLLTPMQRVDLQMRLRQQRIGMQMTLEEMPTALESWSAHLNESGAMLMGGGGAGMGGSAGNLGLSRDNYSGGATAYTSGNPFDAARDANMAGAKNQLYGMYGLGGAGVGATDMYNNYGGGAGAGWAGGGAY